MRKSLNVYSFRILGSTLGQVARDWDLLAPGKRTGVLSRPVSMFLIMGRIFYQNGRIALFQLVERSRFVCSDLCSSLTEKSRRRIPQAWIIAKLGFEQPGTNQRNVGRTVGWRVAALLIPRCGRFLLVTGHAASVARDKFLVMSTEIDEEKTPSELANVWKNTPKADIAEHRSV